MKQLGFVINPIAGMGGRVGLKGTDGVSAEARARGATPVAEIRARDMLTAFKRLRETPQNQTPVSWLTCNAQMGANALEQSGFAAPEIAYRMQGASTGEDTVMAVRAFMDCGVDLIVFCGGDGTARDVCGETNVAVPILGVPCGVKMYSGVFGTTPAQTARILHRYLNDELDLAEVDVLDVDEEAFREDRWSVRLYYKAITPFEPTLSQQSKAIIASRSDDEVKADIADYLSESMAKHPETLYLLGPGSTVQSLAKGLGVKKTLLGIDAVAAGRVVQHDVNEADILRLLPHYPRHVVILSPIGAQGFVLGRGNLPLSPAVINTIGLSNITVVATPAKLASVHCLRFDSGDTALDTRLHDRRYWQVITGYRRYRMVPTQRQVETHSQSA